MNIKEVLSYELSPVLASLFDDGGNMQLQAKSTLKQKLQVEVSSRLVHLPDVVIIDGCAMLWTVHWLTSGNVEDYVKNFTTKIKFHLRNGDVYLVFDRYHPNSTKNVTRSNRAGKNVSWKHQLTLQTQLPAQKVVLTVPHNKKQLIDLICQYLINNVSCESTRLTITGDQPTPIQLYENTVTNRADLRATHEEADVIMVQQMVKVAEKGCSNIKVICDDTDVFVLLVFYYDKENLSCYVSMASPVAIRNVINIKATALDHKNIVCHLPATHALTGCDTVS